MTNQATIVAIDGPAGAGKSTVARKLAARLGYVLLDTGALYRTVALKAKRLGLSWGNEPAVAAVAEALAAGDSIAVEPEPGGGMRVLLEHEDVSAAIRAHDMSAGASRVSAITGVRAALMSLQRTVARGGRVVAEGRDMGTVVFPRARVKIFLTASDAVRAERRRQELALRGQEMPLDEVLRDLRERDRADSERPIAPLRPADDAVRIDTTGRSIDAVVEQLERIVRAAES